MDRDILDGKHQLSKYKSHEAHNYMSRANTQRLLPNYPFTAQQPKTKTQGLYKQHSNKSRVHLASSCRILANPWLWM